MAKVQNWKGIAMGIGVVIGIMTMSNLFNFIQYRFLYASPLIPDYVRVQVSQPYLTGLISSAIVSIALWSLFYLSRFKAAVAIGALQIIFDYVHFQLGW
jgi:hypothetical protein